MVGVVGGRLLVNEVIEFVSQFVELVANFFEQL